MTMSRQLADALLNLLAVPPGHGKKGASQRAAHQHLLETFARIYTNFLTLPSGLPR